MSGGSTFYFGVVPTTGGFNFPSSTLWGWTRYVGASASLSPNNVSGDNMWTEGADAYGTLTLVGTEWDGGTWSPGNSAELQAVGADQFIGSFGSNGTWNVMWNHYVMRRTLTTQTIGAGSWSFNIGGAESDAGVNASITPVILVYRPSTTTVVGYIYDGGAATTELTSSAGSYPFGFGTKSLTVSGSSLSVTSGDQLIISLYLHIAPTGGITATPASCWLYDQNTYSSGNAPLNVTSPSTISFNTDPPNGPTVSSATFDDYNLSLTWGTVSGAAAYSVYFPGGASNNGDFNGTCTTPITGTTASDTGLTGNTSYIVYLYCNDGNQKGSWGIPTQYNFVSAPNMPGRSTSWSLALDPTDTRTKVDVTWTLSPGAVGYSLDRSTDNSTWTTISTVTSGSPTSYTDTGLTAGTKYFYRMKFCNSSTVYSRYATSLNITTDTYQPKAPTNLRISPGTGNTSLTLLWDDSDPMTTEWKLQRADDSGFTTNVQTYTSITVKNYLSTGLTFGTNYYYRVAGYNSTYAGYGPYSTVLGPVTPYVVGSDSGTATDGVATLSPLVTMLYFGSVASSTVSTAQRMTLYPTADSTANPTTFTGKTTGWGELWSQGNASAWPSAGSQGAPSGRGFMYDDTDSTFASMILKYSASNYIYQFPSGFTSTKALSGSLVCRLYVYNSGTYTLLSSASNTITNSTSLNSGALALLLNSASDYTIASGDKFYFDYWLNITSAPGSTSNVITVGEGTSNGVQNFLFQVVFPVNIGPTADSGTGSDSSTSILVTTPVSATDSTPAGSSSTTLAASLTASDSGTGNDSGTISATVTTADTGTANDGTATSSDSLTASDTGAVSEGPYVIAPRLAAIQTIFDSGTGAESATFAASLTTADSGAASDSGTVSGTPTASDSGTRSEGPYTIGPSASDSGTGTDTAGTPQVIEIPISASDSGTQNNLSYAIAVGGITESGTATNSGTISAPTTASDSGTRSEGPYTIGISVTDSGTRSEGPYTIAPAASDSGTGSESTTSALTVTASDSGTESDGTTATAVTASDSGIRSEGPYTIGISVSDSGTGADAVSTPISLAASDSGTGTDSTALTASLVASDAGTATEAATYTATLTTTDSATSGQSAQPYSINTNKLPPDAIITDTNLTGPVGNIQDDPDGPDTQWDTSTAGQVAATDIRTSFPTPPGTGEVLEPGAGVQEFRILVRLS